jgi:NAD(P)-dependent dehydrogenase (short-subunit alcohol dehydrogenase family)
LEGTNFMLSLPDGFRAVVIGANGGIGRAICENLQSAIKLGELIKISRSRDGFDLMDEASIAGHARSLSGKPVHLLICATGILTVADTPPEKALRHLAPDVMLAQFQTNAIGPALVAKHYLPLLDRNARSTAAFLSARVGSIGDNRLGGWISYRASKAALNQVVRTASIELARTHPGSVVIAVHPGTVRTALSKPYYANHPTVSADEAAANILITLDGMDSSRTGRFVAYDGSEIPW